MKASFSKNSYQKILLGIFVFSLISFILAIIQIAQGNIGGFQPLLYGIGFLLYSAFNWADVLVFSLLWMIIALILWNLKEKIYFWVAFFSFWLVRSAGETVYSFLQQFTPGVKPWLAYTPRALLQNSLIGHYIYLKYWVVEQIFFQSISVLSLLGLVYKLAKLLKDRND